MTVDNEIAPIETVTATYRWGGYEVEMEDGGETKIRRTVQRRRVDELRGSLVEFSLPTGDVADLIRLLQYAAESRSER